MVATTTAATPGRVRTSVRDTPPRVPGGLLPPAVDATGRVYGGPDADRSGVGGTGESLRLGPARHLRPRPDEVAAGPGDRAREAEPVEAQVEDLTAPLQSEAGGDLGRAHQLLTVQVQHHRRCAPPS